MPYADPEKNRACIRAANEKRTARRIAAGLCTDCDQPRAGNGALCLAHRAKKNVRNRKHFGFVGTKSCGSCGRPGHYAKTCTGPGERS